MPTMGNKNGLKNPPKNNWKVKIKIKIQHDVFG
jgi:hypothetical protein